MNEGDLSNKDNFNRQIDAIQWRPVSGNQIHVIHDIKGIIRG